MIHNFQVLNVNCFFHLLGRFESGRLESSKFPGELSMASRREVRLTAKEKVFQPKNNHWTLPLSVQIQKILASCIKPGCCRCRSMPYIFMVFFLRPSSREQGWTDLPASFFLRTESRWNAEAILPEYVAWIHFFSRNYFEGCKNIDVFDLVLQFGKYWQTSLWSRQTKTIAEIFHALSKSRKLRSQSLQRGRAKASVLSVPKHALHFYGFSFAPAAENKDGQIFLRFFWELNQDETLKQSCLNMLHESIFFCPKLFWRLQKHWCIRSCFAIWKILADITLKPPDQNHCWNLPCSVQI